jgi:hypothetical protein
MGEPSGVAVRLLLSDALDRLLEVRGNAETALVRAQQMALTLGNNARLFEGNIGTFENGDFEHAFHEREAFPLSMQEQSEIVQGFVKAGFSIMTAAHIAGLHDEHIEQLEKDLAEEERRSQAQVENALALAQERAAQRPVSEPSQTRPDARGNGTEPEVETA